MSDFFQDVTEELRSDQLRELWRRFGKYVIAVPVVVIVATVVNVFYTDYRTSNFEAVGDRYMDAAALLASGDQEAALQAFGVIAATEGGGYAVLARLEEAGIYVSSGETEQAIAAYQAIAEDGSVPARFQHVASFLIATHLIRLNDFDGAEPWLAPLMAEGSAYVLPAKELYAFSIYQRGDRATAQLLYTELAENAFAPAELRARAADMLAIINSGGM